MKIQCDVYKSARHADMYLYVREEDGFERVPQELIERFGPSEKALSFELSPERKMAREDANKVIQNLNEHGYHLQLPPPKYGPRGS